MAKKSAVKTKAKKAKTTTTKSSKNTKVKTVKSKSKQKVKKAKTSAVKPKSVSKKNKIESKSSKAPKAKNAAAKLKNAAKSTKSQNWQKYLAPLYDRVLLQKAEPFLKSSSGLLFLPNEQEAEFPSALVLAVGKGLRSSKGNIRPIGVEVGQNVLYRKWNGTDIEVDGKKLIIVREEDIVAIENKK